MSTKALVQRTLLGGAIAVLAALATVAPAAPAEAAPGAAAPAISVSPSTNLDPNGAFVVVRGSGFIPGTQLFVMQCRSTSTDDHTCNSVGLRKVTTDAAGAFTANAMRVVANFGATDCLRTTCAIKTSAVSNHANDRSQDRMATISFRAAAPATTAPPMTPAPTAPPTTAPPTTAAPTTAPPTTTTAAPTTTAPGGGGPDAGGADDEGGEDPDAGADADAERAEDRPAAAGETEVAGADEAAASGETGAVRSADGGGPGPWLVVGALAALAAAGAAGAVWFRRRNAS